MNMLGDFGFVIPACNDGGTIEKKRYSIHSGCCRYDGSYLHGITTSPG